MSPLVPYVVAQLLHLDSDDPRRDITRQINSPGGDVYSGLAIYDTMQFVPSDVRTICCGMAMSMGAFLLAAGAPGKRIATPHARVMIHQVLSASGFSGLATDIDIRAREIVSLRRMLDEMLVAHTGRSYDEVARDTERDNFMSAAEARDYGIVDSLTGERGATG